jgi:ABC-type multidrug transport system fused ATPase/permease subunit
MVELSPISLLPSCPRSEPIKLAADYPLLNSFWTILEIFFFVLWIWLVITVYVDIFRSRDLSGGGKALWVLFVLILPVLGVLVYLIIRGGKMHERAVQQAEVQQDALRGYIQQMAAGAPASTADQLTKLADLRERGVVSAEEFDREKAKLLSHA